MVICKKSRLSTVEDLEIKVNNYVIESVEYQIVLGVSVDKTLSWSFHVKQICNILHSNLHLFSKISCFLNLDTRKLFYNAYILPLFDYCSVVWGNCQKGEQNQLLKFKKRACNKIIYYIQTIDQFQSCATQLL